MLAIEIAYKTQMLLVQLNGVIARLMEYLIAGSCWKQAEDFQALE